ncbi:mandelate racemase/muconate lactonizing enzyme family protein [Pseudoruegeria sp. SHC-113]|uniref:mandelate racemase/muconate lactonizing enzyme family protein n=1 Tax=Pseudoruegeria sp. SHC-113 TaxID=2855439 RepID=UPI0021BB44EE|nr:mandelate racemase/muconate lactonizing enzyme family protein [Pseudoruegeria sp. SHC-113]MCT8160673.1 mandelate racemase/muconate lactonizing enzyme family protein [Pseudoruegeria sp. SHC-113]
MSRAIAEVRPIHARVGKRNQLLLKITLEDGTYGWGESGLTGRELAVDGMIKHLTPILLGQDPFRIARIWQELYRSQYNEGGSVIASALSAIDIALHDIKGKCLGVPVHELLGGAQRHSVPGFASTAREPDAVMIEEAKRLVAEGWQCFRLSPAQHYTKDVFDARASIAETAKWMVRAREELGPEPMIGLDYHHRLSVAEAAMFCQMMPPGTLDFLEEPIRNETPAAYAALRAQTAVNFAIGEEFTSKWQALPYVEQDLAQFIRIDLCLVGGFTEAMKIAGWCEAHYVDIMPHNPLGPICTAASVHFGAAIANFAYLECRDTPVEACGFDVPEVFVEQCRLEGAAYPVPQGPGLGVEVDESKLLPPAPIESVGAPRLRRPDGGVANW